MDPCFRFPWDDLKDLFDHATLVEAMLVALDHMQVNFVQVSSTGLRKFRRNTLSFPQDVGTFAQRHGLMKNFRVGDRVNSVRGLGDDPRNPDRDMRRATTASAAEREQYAVGAGGALIFPARVLEVRKNGELVLQYDNGGEGIEWQRNVTPRLVMPWHPKDVPLHLMLRRNVGRGKNAVEGLHVRWWYVANLLQALCACPRNGDGPWRLGGTEDEPMHKFYDPKMFHVMSEEEMNIEYAPKERDGVLLTGTEVGTLSATEKLAAAVDVETPEHFIAAGFDVNFVGPVTAILAGSGSGLQGGELAGGGGADDVDRDESDTRADGGVAAGQAQQTSAVPVADVDEDEDVADMDLYVDEETFCVWLDRGEFAYGAAVQRWWARLGPGEEGEVDTLKNDDDETNVEFFRRIRTDLLPAKPMPKPRTEAEESEDRAVKVVHDEMVLLPRLVEWLQERLGKGLGCADEGVSEELLMGEILHEMTIAARCRSGGGDTDKGGVRDPMPEADEEEEALRMAERLVYGYPSKNDEPTGAHSWGRSRRLLRPPLQRVHHPRTVQLGAAPVSPRRQASSSASLVGTPSPQQARPLPKDLQLRHGRRIQHRTDFPPLQALSQPRRSEHLHRTATCANPDPYPATRRNRTPVAMANILPRCIAISDSYHTASNTPPSQQHHRTDPSPPL